MIKIGIVGVGGMGTVHISNYAHIDGCKVVALCDISEAAAGKADEIGASLYTDLDEMLMSEELDVVDVCTPTFMHKQHVMKALQQGKHVIVEKPIALNSEDVKEMFALAKQKDLHLFVGQVLRFTRESGVLRQLVESGEYGKVLDASFSRLSACPRWIKNGWLFDKAKSGLLPFDLHIHDLDLIVSLFGKPKDFSFTSCGNKDKSYKEHYRFNYNYGDFNVCAQAAWYNADIPFTATWQVYFENAVVINDKQGVIAYRFDHEPYKFDTEERIKIPTGINVPPTEIYLNELTHFMDCLREDKDSHMISEEQIITVMEILSSIDKMEQTA